MISEKIDIFIEVAETLCFSEVAKLRYTTQPTISRQISSLEQDWGIELFVRTNKGLRLTPEGSVMLGCCKKMNQMCQNNLKLAKEIRASKRDRLRIGFLEVFDVERIFMPYLQKFSEVHPDLDVTVSSNTFSKLRQGLAKNEYDIIYTLDFEVQSMEGDIVADYLGELPIWFAVSDRHPLYRKEELSINDLEGEIFYLPGESDSAGRQRDLEQILHANGISNSQIRFMANVNSVNLQMKLGKGIALLDSGG